MRILLAPMEGLLDHMLRDTLTQIGGTDPVKKNHSGFDLCVSEFIRITDGLLPDENFYRIVPELKNNSRTPSGVPVRVQILGSDPICMAENAAKLAELGAYGVDLNFGCPSKMVNLHHGGAALLKEPHLLYHIVNAVRKAVPSQISVTAKMRLGYDTPEYAVDCAEALSAGGAAEIVVHARTKTDGYKPPAYWEWIAKIREAVTTPIIANGEIWSADDAQRCRDISGCADIMVGRGAVANPALALMIRGERDAPLSWDEMQRLLHHFWRSVERHISARNRNGRIKQWLHYLSRDYAQAQEQFDIIRRMVDPDEIDRALFADYRYAA